MGRFGQRWPQCTALRLSWKLTKGFTWRRSACCFAVRRAGAVECVGSNSSVDAASAAVAVAAASSCRHYWPPCSATCVCASASVPFAGPAGSCRRATAFRKRPGRRPGHVRARVSPVTLSLTLPFLKILMQRRTRISPRFFPFEKFFLT